MAWSALPSSTWFPSSKAVSTCCRAESFFRVIFSWLGKRLATVFTIAWFGFTLTLGCCFKTASHLSGTALRRIFSDFITLAYTLFRLVVMMITHGSPTWPMMINMVTFQMTRTTQGQSIGRFINQIRVILLWQFMGDIQSNLATTIFTSAFCSSQYGKAHFFYGV